MVEDAVQLVDRRRSERVADLGPVDAHPNHADVDGPVVRDVGQVLEPGDGAPGVGVEQR